MDNIVEIDGDQDRDFLMRAITHAHENKKTIRFYTNSDGLGPYLKVKVGEGMWSAPLHSEQPLFEVIAETVVEVEA
jgi:hypothetical protein